MAQEGGLQDQWDETRYVDEYAPADIWGNELQTDPEDPYLEYQAPIEFLCARCGHPMAAEDEGGCPECAGTKLEAA